MLEKVNFKTWILLLHTSAISKSYSTYKKVSVGLWNFDNGGSKLVIICLAEKSGNQRKNLAKTVLLNYYSSLKKEIRFGFTKYNSFF